MMMPKVMPVDAGSGWPTCSDARLHGGADAGTDAESDGQPHAAHDRGCRAAGHSADDRLPTKKDHDCQLGKEEYTRPVYEYKCNGCGEKFEVLRSLKDNETEVKCPECGATDTRRLYSLFGRRSSADSCSPKPRHFG